MQSEIKNIDCLQYIKSINSNTIDLAILDPPYNINAADWDNIPDYINWMQNILSETKRVLKPNGSLYLWGMVKNNDFLKLKIWLDEFEDYTYKNWIVWLHEVKIHKKLKDRFLNKHEDLLFYAGKNNTFNIIRDKPTQKQLEIFKNKYDHNYFVERDKLPPSQYKIFKNGLQLGSPAKSWWKGKSNISNGKKYNNFMGYKSEWVSERIIKASSNIGDKVLIPFAGTGTECVSAKKLERIYLACELNTDRYNISLNRINSFLL